MKSWRVLSVGLVVAWACSAGCSSNPSAPSHVELRGTYEATTPGAYLKMTFYDSSHYFLFRSPCDLSSATAANDCIESGTYALNPGDNILALRDVRSDAITELPFNVITSGGSPTVSAQRVHVLGDPLDMNSGGLTSGGGSGLTSGAGSGLDMGSGSGLDMGSGSGLTSDGGGLTVSDGGLLSFGDAGGGSGADAGGPAQCFNAGGQGFAQSGSGCGGSDAGGAPASGGDSGGAPSSGSDAGGSSASDAGGSSGSGSGSMSGSGSGSMAGSGSGSGSMAGSGSGSMAGSGSGSGSMKGSGSGSGTMPSSGKGSGKGGGGGGGGGGMMMMGSGKGGGSMMPSGGGGSPTLPMLPTTSNDAGSTSADAGLAPGFNANLEFAGSCNFLHTCSASSKTKPAGDVAWACSAFGVAMCSNSDPYVTVPNASYCGHVITFCNAIGLCTNGMAKGASSPSQTWQAGEAVLQALGMPYGDGTGCPPNQKGGYGGGNVTIIVN